MLFWKYQSQGNDYAVLEWEEPITPNLIRRLCMPHTGLGVDGVVVQDKHPKAKFGVRIYNSDGSETEASGNGLRIFARYLWDTHKIGRDPMPIGTQGGVVTAQVLDYGRLVSINLGRPQILSSNEQIEVNDQLVTIWTLNLGNPQTVVLNQPNTPQIARTMGPLIETHPRFPQRTNVQFLQVLDRKNLAVKIWERGTGYTLSSGSSACAATIVAHHLGECDDNVTVQMPGGAVSVEITTDGQVVLQGNVVKVAKGIISRETLLA